MNTDSLGLFLDDGVYTILAKALSEGEGYRILSLPTSPFEAEYPFLYPYVLSGVWWLNPSLPENIFLLKAVNVGFLFAVLLLSYCFYRQNTERRSLDVLPYVFLAGGNLAVFSYTMYAVSETLFLALTLLALLLSGQRSQPSATSLRVALLSGAVALAYLTRAVGVALIFAGIFHFLAARRRRECLLYLAILSVLIAPWLLWQLSHTTAGLKSSLLHYYVAYDYKSLAFVSAWSNPSQAIQIVWGNLRYLVDSFDQLFFLHFSPWLRLAAYILFILGIYYSFRRLSLFSRAFFVLYLLLVLSWPWHPLRLIIPVIPLLFFFMFAGTQAVEWAVTASIVSPRIKRLSTLLIRFPLAVIVALNLVWLSVYLQGDNTTTVRAWYGGRLPYTWDGFTETFAWLREHTKGGDVLATAYDPMYYLYTGRQAVRPWFHKPETYFYPYGQAVANVGSALDVRRELALLDVRYLIVDPLDGYSEKQAAMKLFEDLLQSYPVKPTLVFVSADGFHQVYSLPVTDSFRRD